MLRNIVIGFSFTGLILTTNPAFAADDVLEMPMARSMAAAPVDFVEVVAVKPTLYQAASDAYYGGADLVNGGHSLLKTAGGLGRDVLYTADALGNLIAGTSKVALSPFMLAFKDKDAARTMASNGKDNLFSGFSSLGEVAKNVPGNAKNFKDVFVNTYEAGKKFGTAAHKVYNSEPVQNNSTKTKQAFAKVGTYAKNAFNTVKEKASNVLGRLSPFSNTFENVTF